MRERGFYWVNYKDEWRIGEYFSLERNWYLTGEPGQLEDHEMSEIDERPIVREETDSKNIIQGLLEEIARNRELLKEYESIPEGIFGATMIKHTIARAELAMIQGDTIAMIVEYQNLKESQ